jgi:uncharacterized membrane protein
MTIQAWMMMIGCALLASACSGGETSSCPNDLPVSCPADAAGYQKTVGPLIQARCVVCHSATGEMSDEPLDTYQRVFDARGAVLDQVHACRMPLAGATPLTAAERAELLGWLVCGAPDD